MTSYRNTKQCHLHYYILVFTTTVSGNQRCVISTLHMNHLCIQGTSFTWSFKLNSKQHIQRMVYQIFLVNLPFLIFRDFSSAYPGDGLGFSVCRRELLEQPSLLFLSSSDHLDLCFGARGSLGGRSMCARRSFPLTYEAGTIVGITSSFTQCTFCFWFGGCVCALSLSPSFSPALSLIKYPHFLWSILELAIQFSKFTPASISYCIYYLKISLII